MSIRIFALSLSLFLVSCQTPSDLVGSGPLNLSTNIERYYNERYIGAMGAQYFVVSKDGRHANFTYCPAGAGGCGGAEIIYEVIEGCEKRAGQECFIYAQNGFVVWDGPVTVGGSNQNRIASFSDEVICNFATVLDASGPAWETRSRYEPHIEEAKKRGLTPEKCRQ